MTDSPTIYLHDIRDDVTGLVGANLGNADNLAAVEKYLSERPGVTITADDGYRSVRRLVPALRETGSRLILFVTTGFISREVFPYEMRLSTILAGRDQFTIDGTARHLPNDPARTAAFTAIHHSLKAKSTAERAAYMAKLYSDNALDPTAGEDDIHMTWDELRDLAGSGVVEIGAHTHSHVFLPARPFRERRYEIAQSARLIRQHLGTAPRTFSYPYGGNDRATRTLVRLTGFQVAYGTEHASDARFDRRRIPLPI